MAAYRSGGEDMPILNAAQLEDLDHLRITLRMGIDKLERWLEFRKQANEISAGEADADRAAVGDALDEMANFMERSPYFDPELPASFDFLPRQRAIAWGPPGLSSMARSKARRTSSAFSGNGRSAL
jgi:hypothetical protein